MLDQLSQLEIDIFRQISLSKYSGRFNFMPCVVNWDAQSIKKQVNKVFTDAANYTTMAYCITRIEQEYCPV